MINMAVAAPQITLPSFLHIEEIQANEELRLEIQNVASAWRDISREEIALCSDVNTRELYGRVERVNGAAIKKCRWVKKFLHKFSILICSGFDLEIKGFAFIKPITLGDRTFIHLNLLSTDPKNLFRESRIEKVGTFLIQSLFQKCRDEGFAGIYTHPSSK